MTLKIYSKIYKKSKILEEKKFWKYIFLFPLVNPSRACFERKSILKKETFYVFSLIRSRDSVYRYTLKSGPLKKGTTRELRSNEADVGGEETLKASIKGESCGSYYGYYTETIHVRYMFRRLKISWNWLPLQ